MNLKEAIRVAGEAGTNYVHRRFDNVSVYTGLDKRPETRITVRQAAADDWIPGKHFTLEPRYIVIKRTHLEQIPEAVRDRLDDALGDYRKALNDIGIVRQETIVIERDWPMWNLVRNALQRWVDSE